MPASDSDDVRRRFREALDRKQRKRHGSAAGADPGGEDKSHGASGPVKSQRTFRRKSG
jgi:hypothetical protein